MIFKKCLLVAAAISIPAGFSMAGDAAKPKVKIKDACKSDLETLCADVEKAKGWRGKCLRGNEANLSPDCAKAVAMKPANWGRAKKGATPAEGSPKE